MGKNAEKRPTVVRIDDEAGKDGYYEGCKADMRDDLSFGIAGAEKSVEMGKKEKQFFVIAETDEFPTRIEKFVRGETPKKALDDFVSQFPPSVEGDLQHLFPLEFADLYADANAYHKGRKPLATLYKQTSEYYRRKKNGA